MNTEALFLFLILLLGLVLCSFLGGNCGREGMTGNFTGTLNLTGNSNTNPPSTSGASTASGSQYDNYNHFTGSSTKLSPGSTFYGQNGTTAVVIANSNGSQSLQITLPGSATPVTFSPQQPKDASSSKKESYTNYGSITTYYGPNGAIAQVINTDNGQQAIMVKTSSGTYYYNVSGTPTTTNTSTQYYGSTGYSVQEAPYTLAYQEPYGGSVGAITGPRGNTVVGATSNSDYSSSLPPGIPASQIPPGQEDLYILKSQVVPPVCPACPTCLGSGSSSKRETCPPCPPCGRCPEPSFECKKVPNYNAINNEYLPAPILSDFSSFGM